MFGSPPFNRPGLFSYQWSPATLSLAYVGLGKYRRSNHIAVDTRVAILIKQVSVLRSPLL
jgi:hypothetical protein